MDIRYYIGILHTWNKFPSERLSFTQFHKSRLQQLFTTILHRQEWIRTLGKEIACLLGEGNTLFRYDVVAVVIGRRRRVIVGMEDFALTVKKFGMIDSYTLLEVSIFGFPFTIIYLMSYQKHIFREHEMIIYACEMIQCPLHNPHHHHHPPPPSLQRINRVG